MFSVSAAPAMAVPTTFAQYFQTNGALQQWSITTSGGTSTINGTGSAFFIFSGVPGLPFSGPELAQFSLTARSAQRGACGVACGPGDSFVQPGYTGTFAFIDAGSRPGTNLLSGLFAVAANPAVSGAQFSSAVGSTGGSFNASDTAGNLNQLVLTSDYVSFVVSTSQNASFSLSSLIPNFFTGAVAGNQAYPGAGAFGAAGSGTFSSDPAPFNAVPEPASLLLLGAGMAGLALLRRQVPAKKPAMAGSSRN